MATKAQRLREAAKAAKLAAASAAKVADLDEDDDDDADASSDVGTGKDAEKDDDSENPKRVAEYAIVERLRDDGRFWECGRVSPPSLVSADYLGHKFGGGLFQVTSYGPTGKKSDRFGFTGKRTVRADPEVYAKKDTAPANGSQAMGTELLGFVVQQMSTLAASQQQQQQAFMSSQDMMQKMNLAVITTMLDSKKTDPGIMTLVAEMIRSKNEAATNPAEMFKLAADLIRKDGGGGGGGLKDKIEELSMLRDLMDGTDKDKTWLDVAADYAPMFERAIGAMTPRAEPVKALPAGPDATVKTLPSPNPDMNQQLVGYVRQRLPKWAKKAEEGKDASLQADSFLDDVPVGVYPRLLDVLKRDDLLDQLAVLDARVSLYREWFGRFIARCVEVIEAQAADENDDDDDDGAE